MTEAAFTSLFDPIDDIIMASVGDDIRLIAPSGTAINTKCVLRSKPGTVGEGSFDWAENIMANIDVYTVIVDVLEKNITNVGKTWTANYQDKSYLISEIVPKGDLTVSLILNQPGNSAPTPAGWQ